MSTILQIVDDAGGVLFDLNGTNGVDAGSVVADFGVGGTFNLGSPDPELVVISPPSAAGGSVVSRRDPLTTTAWRQHLEATTYDLLVQGVGYLARLLAAGGTIKWIPEGSAHTRYIDFEPSPAPALLDGQSFDLLQVVLQFAKPHGVPIGIIRQPYLRGDLLSASTNVLENATFLYDNDGTANRPDRFSWSNASPVSAEDIVGSTDPSYTLTLTAGTISLQQTYVGGSATQVWTGSVYARITAGTAQCSMDLIWRNSGGTAIGTATGGTTTLTSSWQRISGSGTAPTNTAQITYSPKYGAEVSGDLRTRYGQLEQASSASLFRVGVETVAFNPAATGDPARTIPVYCQGDAPSLATLRLTADANEIAYAKVYRETVSPVEVMQSVLYKRWAAGTLGTDTAGTADANATGGTVADVNFTASDPAFRSISSGGGTGDTITIAKPAGLAVGDVIYCRIWRTQETTIIGAPGEGWSLLGTKQQTTNTYATKSVLWAWIKVADADDVAATEFVFNVLYPSGGTQSYRYVAMAVQNVDNSQPLAAPPVFSVEAATTAPTASGLTPDSDAAFIIADYCGLNSTGSLSFTAPTGTTPTFTERDDGTADVTYRGGAVYTGVLATAAATGTKDATAAIAIDAAMVMVALRKAPTALETRSSVTFTSLEPGVYDVWCRLYPTAASIQRIRLGYALLASPSETQFTSFDDLILDTTAASAFAYVDHSFGRIHIPKDYALATLTLRLQAGLEATSTADLRADYVALAPANEQVGAIVSPSVAASGEFLASVASKDRAYHLDSSEDLKEIATVEGPTPVELLPGLNMLEFVFAQVKATGFPDRATDLDAVPSVAVNHSPNYRA